MIKKIFPSLSSLGSDGNTAFLRAARAGHLDKVLDHLKNNVDINTSNTNGLNALHLASKDGHIDVVTELLNRGANVDSATKKGNTALHIASLAGQEDVVKLLVENNASVNVQSQNGFTPLYMAAQENHDSVVKYLLANNANQSLATEDGFTPLAVAMQQGHDKVVAVLLENDSRGKVRLPALHIAAKKDDCKAAALLLQNEHNPDVTSKSGFTPLHIASHYGNEGIAQLLLSKSADVNYSAKHNITPLHVAAKWGKANMVALLLDRGANIEAKTRDGLTPLHCAARSGHEQVVDMLLERGAPISAKTKNGLAPLHMASQGDHVDAARILLYHRAPVDDVTVDYLTALHVAAHCGHAAVARLLLDRKADPNARALNGFTPLHIACKKNRIKVVELLLKHGASIEATTESGLTPLHVASFMGCMNIVIYLVQNEASPDVTTVRGETPLHLAARANQTDIIRILLRNGAHVSARAREQQTPLHIASRLGNVDIVMLLLQHGANVDCTTKDLYTPLHIAAKEGQEEVASVLVENGASLEAQTKKGFTPLHLAAKYGNMKVAKLLLQRDAPVDAQGKNGVTSLHVASHYDHQNVALLLLEKGASPHATAKNGHTPLHIAARKNQMDIATTLLEYGAKAETESKAGFTPLHLSSQEGHTDMTTLLLDHHADPNHKAKNGLTPLHLCAQEDRVEVGSILLKNKAEIDATTKAGYTPLHVACHFGQANMVRLLLAEGASVKTTTAVNYTPLHQAAQQGHAGIVTTLLQSEADPNQTTNQGQTALSIAQKLGYISVVESLKGVTQAPVLPPSNEDKYKVVAPETMQETFMSDSEDEGGEDTAMAEQPYHYLTVDEMKTLGDDSLPIDVTKDEQQHADNRDASAQQEEGPPAAIDEQASPQHVKESYSQYTAMDNVEIQKHAQHIGFLVSFLVDARGGAMRGCRHSGVRVIVPPRRAPAPLRITCRYLKRDKMPHPPPLMEGEALASRILELAPVAAKFLGPIMIEVPHFASLRNKEREIVVLRSDNGETWKEHSFEATEEAIQEILSHSFDKEELSQLEESPRTSRILMTELPHYLAVVSRVKQEVHAIGPEGGMVSSTVVPQVQAVFPQGALTKKIKVGLQAQPIPIELTAKLLGNRVAVSPIVTVEPRRRKFHKPITLTIPVPQAASKGMINTYSGDAPTLRLLCSITGGTTRAQWEDVTGSTPLTFVNDCVSFTTTVSARFWLMDCRNIADATKMATELYREAIHVPFMAKFVVFAKRTDMTEARLRVFCMTDDKEDKTLEHQEHFTEVAKSRDVEVLEGKTQYVEFAGNLIPITKSGDQLQLGFRAFKENRLPFTVKVKDPHADAIGRILFMREPKVAKGDAPQQPICILNIVLPDNIIPEPLTPDHEGSRLSFVEGVPSWQRLTEVSDSLGDDWIRLAGQLEVSMSQVNRIKTEYCDSPPSRQGLLMLKQWVQDAGNKASGSTLEEALRKIGRYDIVERCLYNEDQIQVSTYGKNIEIINKQLYSSPVKDICRVEPTVTKKQDLLDKDDREERKYLAEEKEVTEVEMKSVSERKKEIESRLSEESDGKKKDPAVGKKPDRNEKIPDLNDDVSKNNFKETKSIFEKDVKEKSKSPEPAELSFSEKRLSFELGHHIAEKKLDMTQKFLDSEKMVYKMISDPDPEPELSFQEKLLSFEKGTNKPIPTETKPPICPPEEIESAKKEIITEFEKKESIETIKEFKQFDEDTKKEDEFKIKEMIITEAQVLKSPVTSATPPPSPADVLKTKGGEDWKSQSTSDTDGEKIKNVAQKLEETFTFENLSVLPEIQKAHQVSFDQFNIDKLSKAGNILPAIEAKVDVKKSTNPFESETNSPTIFRSHRAADCVIFDDEDWDTQDIVDFSTGNEQVLDVNTTNKTFDNSNQTKPDSKTTFAPFQVYNFPDEQFQPFEGNIFPLNNLSYSQQESLKGSIDPNKIGRTSIEQYPSGLNIGKPMKYIIDFQSSETENESPPNQNLLAEDPRRLVDIVEVTEDSNLLYFQPDIIPTSSQNIKVGGESETQIKILNDSLRDNISDNLDNNFSEKMSDPKSERQNKDFFNLDQQNYPDEDMVLVDLEYEIVHKTGAKSASSPIMDSKENVSSNKNIVVPIGGVGEKFSEVEDLSKIEDELNFLEKLEGQIKLLKEEEAKMKDIKAELGKSSSDHIKESQSSEYLEKDINELESTKEDSIVETTFDDDFENNLAEGSQNTLELSREAPVVKEESNKKKKNRKRKSKKLKEEDLKEPTSSKSMNTASPASRSGQCETDDLPEREFQKIVSQLSIEEVDEALKIWNKDVSNIAKQPVLPENQKIQQISYNRCNEDTLSETCDAFPINEANVDVEISTNPFETVTNSPAVFTSPLSADCDVLDNDDLSREDITDFRTSNDQVLDVITTNKHTDDMNQTITDSKSISQSFQEPIFSEEQFQPLEGNIFPSNNSSYSSQLSLESCSNLNKMDETPSEEFPDDFNIYEPLKCVDDLRNSETGNDSLHQTLLAEDPRNPIGIVEVIQQSNTIYYSLDVSPISSQSLTVSKELENQINLLDGCFLPLSNIKSENLDNYLMFEEQNQDFFVLSQQNKFKQDSVLVDLDYELVHMTDIKSVSTPTMGSKTNETSNPSIVLPSSGLEIVSGVEDLCKLENELIFLGDFQDKIELQNDEIKIIDIKSKIGKDSLCKSKTILGHFKEIRSSEYLENDNINNLKSVKEESFLETTSDDEFSNNLTEESQTFSNHTIELSREESIMMKISESKKFNEDDFIEPTSDESMDFTSHTSTTDQWKCDNKEGKLQNTASQQSFKEVDKVFYDVIAKEPAGARRPPLIYDISLDEEPEFDPTEHDWRFNLLTHLEKEEEIQSSSKSDKK